MQACTTRSDIGAAPPIHPFQAVSAIVENMPESTIVIGDGAEAHHSDE